MLLESGQSIGRDVGARCGQKGTRELSKRLDCERTSKLFIGLSLYSKGNEESWKGSKYGCAVLRFIF